MRFPSRRERRRVATWRACRERLSSKTRTRATVRRAATAHRRPRYAGSIVALGDAAQRAALYATQVLFFLFCFRSRSVATASAMRRRARHDGEREARMSSHSEPSGCGRRRRASSAASRSPRRARACSRARASRRPRRSTRRAACSCSTRRRRGANGFSRLASVWWHVSIQWVAGVKRRACACVAEREEDVDLAVGGRCKNCACVRVSPSVKKTYTVRVCMCAEREEDVDLAGRVRRARRDPRRALCRRRVQGAAPHLVAHRRCAARRPRHAATAADAAQGRARDEPAAQELLARARQRVHRVRPVRGAVRPSPPSRIGGGLGASTLEVCPIRTGTAAVPRSRGGGGGRPRGAGDGEFDERQRRHTHESRRRV